MNILRAQVGRWASCVAAFAVALAAESALLAVEPARISHREKLTNFFGGEEIQLHFDITGEEAFAGQVRWSISAGERTIAKREVAIEVKPEKGAAVELRHKLPPVKEGVVFPLELRAAVFAAGAEEAIAEFQERLYLFAENPFIDRVKELESLKIVLFDPEETTAKALDALEVPYTRLKNLETLTEISSGILIVGEGVAWQDYGELGKLLLDTAERGVPVLCLPPATAELPLAPVFSGQSAARVSLRRSDIIREMDKRFSMVFAPGSAVEKRSLVLAAEGDALLGHAGEPGKGWPWVEIEYHKQHSRFVWCGFGLVSAWDKSPTPRYLFARILETLAPAEPTLPTP